MRLLWLAGKALLFDSRNARRVLQDGLERMSVQDRMAHIHVPTILGSLVGESELEPFAVEMSEWLRAAQNAGVRVPLLM